MEEINLAETKPDIRKILLIGPEGSGKTHFLGTMPRPMYVFSFDKGYLTLAGEDGVQVGLCMDNNRYSPRAYADFMTKFEALKRGGTYKWKDGREEPYKTIAIDSVSFLSTFLFDHLQKINNNIDKPGGFVVYGAVKSKMQDIINQSILLAENVVCTALVESTKDDITGEIFYVPSMIGSMKNEIGAWFDAVFYMQVDKTGQGNKQYKMLTVGDRRQKAKVRLPSSMQNRLLACEDPDFMKLMAKIGNTEQVTTDPTQGVSVGPVTTQQ